MFEDRIDAGKQLCQKLSNFKKTNTVIMAIPRGGVVVAYQIARQLKVPLGLVFIKKLRSPTNSELAIGAVGSGGIKIIDRDLVQVLGIDTDYIEKEIEEQSKDIKQRENKFYGKHAPSNLKGKMVIIVDDGVATGATIKAAIAYVKALYARKVFLAIPVIGQDAYNKLLHQVDDIIALEIPKQFAAVGQFYKQFPQVTDEEILKIITNIYQ